MSDKIKQCREQIDRIDDELLKLFNQRAALAQQIGHVKGEGAVLRPEREAQVLQRMKQSNRGPLPDEAVAQLYTEIMSQCRALEAPITVAYLAHPAHSVKLQQSSASDRPARVSRARLLTMFFAQWKALLPTMVWYR